MSQFEAGSAYLPPTIAVVIAAGIATNLMGKVGTRPVIVVGAILGAGGDLLAVEDPGRRLVLGEHPRPAGGHGARPRRGLVGTTTAAQNGVSPDKAGLAAALINSSMWLGGALGVAIFSAVATSTTADRLAAQASQAEALTAGFQDALLLAAIFLAAAAVIALRAPNLRAGQAETSPAPDRTAAEPVTEAA